MTTDSAGALIIRGKEWCKPWDEGTQSPRGAVGLRAQQVLLVGLGFKQSDQPTRFFWFMSSLMLHEDICSLSACPGRLPEFLTKNEKQMFSLGSNFSQRVFTLFKVHDQ